MTRTAVLFCPGRGSYGRDQLGTIRRELRDGSAVADALDEADARRRADGRPTVRELDAADTFRPGTHLEGRNAAELIYFATLAQVDRLREQHEVVAVTGNSLGWYTALAAAGALSPQDGWRLVATMAELQQLAPGAQLLTTTVDAGWNADDTLAAAVTDALGTVNALGPDHFVARSIRLGGHEVLAGTEAGAKRLLAELPAVDLGDRSFPFRLAGHGPFHTALCGDVAREAQARLCDLGIANPLVHLIDGRGNVHTPWSTDPAELAEYTLHTQVTTTFDFSAATRTAIREFNPDRLVGAGPGTSLRAPIGHVVLREGYRGIRDRDTLFATDLVT